MSGLIADSRTMIDRARVEAQVCVVNLLFRPVTFISLFSVPTMQQCYEQSKK